MEELNSGVDMQGVGVDIVRQRQKTTCHYFHWMELNEPLYTFFSQNGNDILYLSFQMAKNVRIEASGSKK